MKAGMKRSLSGKLAGPLAIGVLATCAVMMTVLTLMLVKRENALLVTRAESSSRLVGESLSFAMSNGVTDVRPVETSLKGLPDILEFRVVPLAGMSSRADVASDDIERRVFGNGKEAVSFGDDDKGGAYLRVSGPIRAQASCTACHSGIAEGQVVAVTTLYLSTADSKKFVEGFVERAVFLTVLATAVLLGVVLLTLGVTAIRPLRRMRDLIGDIAQGRGDLTRRLPVTTSDEIGEVAGLVNSFVDQTQEVVLGIRSFSTLNAGNAEALGSAAGRTRESVAAAAGSIGAARDQIAGMNRQNGSVAASTRDIFGGITALSGRIEEQAAAVTQSSLAISEMSASIDSVAKVTDRKLGSANELLVVTRRGAEKVGEVDAEIADVSKSLNAIGEAIKLINGIASQTSILSMNAAIEAAHAGEYGRGFAVVAEEIRHLAESSSHNAKQITSALKDIIARIGRVLEASTESRESLDRIGAEVAELVRAFQEIAGSTREMSDGGRSILEASQSLMEVTQEIRKGSVEMNEGVERIDLAQAEIARLAASSNRAMEDAADRAVGMDAEMDAIVELAAGALKVGRQLAEAVGRFKVRDAREESGGPDAA